MRHVLVVGEKTSQVKKFATTLCGSYQSTKQAKYVYTYTGKWKQAPQPTTFTFLPLAGHISTIDTVKGYNWGECAPIEIVADPGALRVKHTRKYVTILRKQVQHKDELWLALDPDSEGDNIAMEVVTILQKQLRKSKIPVRRIWNGSLTDKEIQRAFLTPKPWSNLLALGVQGRRYIDAWLGFAGTRELTRAARKVARVKVISVGRVQLPTLYLVVQADLAHETFVVEKRFKLEAKFNTEKGDYTGEHQLGLISSRQPLEQILQKIKNLNQASITSVSQETKRYGPPQPHNTTSAVSLLSKVMKIKAEKALDIMVRLYNEGLLSYPRTENKKFKDGFPHKEIMSKLVKKAELIPFITSIKGAQVRNNGPKKGVEEDHDPIHPTGELQGLNTLDSQHQKAWDILTRYYISLFLSDQLISQLSVVTEVGGEAFGTEGRAVIDHGWKEIQWWSRTKTNDIPALTENIRVEVRDMEIKESQTKPPQRMRDSQLLLDMEKANIGTKSSRPDIIKKIVERNYVQRVGQQLVSTSWGRALIASLAPIWPKLITPDFTSHVEDQMDLVATGQKEYDSMLEELRREYLELHQELFPKIGRYRKLLKELGLEDQKQKVKRIKQQDTSKINKILQENIV